MKMAPFEKELNANVEVNEKLKYKYITTKCAVERTESQVLCVGQQARE